MRTAPAVSVLIAPAPHGIAALGLLALVATMHTLVWAVGFGHAAGFALPLACAVYGAWLVAHANRRAVIELRWDGQVWWLEEPARADADARAADVSIALDLGDWMLLHCRPSSAPEEGPVRRRVRWIPLQRSTLRPHWHALRCALYSPRCAPGQAAPIDDPSA
jgi:hypothetical protein